MGPRRPMTPPTPESGRSQGGPKLGAEASQIAAEITRGLDRLSATGEDWEARCAAMEKIESAVEGGGPAAAQALATLVKALKRPLAVQLQDRRSAVAKQATQLVACLARSMSASFEPLAVHLLPVLCKLAVITIQVISDSADACAREILATCYSARLAQAVCDAVQGKHKDLRAAAASWLTLVVDSWPPPVLERASDALNAALLSGCQDASASVREHAREALAIYAAVSPVSTRPLLAQVLKVDPQLHAKLKRVVDGTAHHSSARSGASRNSGGSGAPAPPARSNGASEPQRRSLPGVSGGVRPQTAPPARLPAAHNGRAAPAFERSDGANALSDSAGSGDSATSSGGSQRRTPRLFQIAQPRSATASPAQDRLAALREKRRRNSRAPDSSSNTTAHSQRETPPAAAAQPPQQPPGTPAFPSGPSPDAATEDLVRSALKSAQRTLGRPPLSLEEIANSPSPMDYLITPNASDVTADRVFSAMATIKAEEARAAAATATLLAERERAGRARGGGESEVPGGEFCIESAEADAEAFRRRAEQELRQRGADRGLSPSLTAGRASAESYDTGVLVADPPGTSAAARMRAEGAAGVLASDDAPQTPDVSTAAAALRAGTPWQGGSAGPRRAGSGEEVPKTTGFLEPEERLMVAAGGIGGAPRAETVDRSPMPYNAPMERVTPGHVLPASEGSPRPRAGAAPALGGARRVPVPPARSARKAAASPGPKPRPPTAPAGQSRRKNLAAAAASRQAAEDSHRSARSEVHTAKDALAEIEVLQLKSQRGTVAWQDRRELLRGLKQLAAHGPPGAAAELASAAERVAPFLLESIADAHRQVSAAGLEAATAFVEHATSNQEFDGTQMQTERLLPEAFRHLAAGREPHASAAERLLAAASERFGPPLVVPATARSLSAIKQSRGRVAVLTWSARYLSGDAPTDARLTPSMVRSWIAAATPMLGDKDRALRNAAVDAFVALDAADPEAIPAFIEMYAAPRERAALLSHLLPACPTIETNLRVFQSRQGMPAHLWPAQGGGAGVGPSSATAQLDRVLSGSVGSAETSPTQHGWTPGLTESNSDTVRGGSPAASPALRAPRAAAEAERAHEERVAGGSQYAQNNSAPHGAGGGYSPISYTPVREADIQDEGVAEGHFQKAIAVLASPARPQGLPLLHQLLFLAELAKMAPSKLWQRYLPQVFSLLRPLLSAPHPADVREHAAVALRDVAVWQPRAAAPLLGTLLPDLLSAAAAEPAAAGEVAGLADEALEAVCGKQDPGACMAVVLRCLPPQGGSPAAEFPSAVLKAGVRCIGRLSKRLHPEQLLEFARQGMMPLTVAASSPSADLRKAAVFAMVDMWVTAGDVLGPLLASHLTDSQLKLVTIYVNKARERQRVQQQA